MEVRRSLVVNATPLETRIALLENGQLCELFIERTTQASQVGDVYKGRVAKLLQGMQSAFVAIGGAKDGFLYLDEPEAHRLPSEESVDEEDLEEASLGFPVQPSLPPVKEGRGPPGPGGQGSDRQQGAAPVPGTSASRAGTWCSCRASSTWASPARSSIPRSGNGCAR